THQLQVDDTFCCLPCGCFCTCLCGCRFCSRCFIRNFGSFLSCCFFSSNFFSCCGRFCSPCRGRLAGCQHQNGYEQERQPKGLVQGSHRSLFLSLNRFVSPLRAAGRADRT